MWTVDDSVVLKKYDRKTIFPVKDLKTMNEKNITEKYIYL